MYIYINYVNDPETDKIVKFLGPESEQNGWKKLFVNLKNFSIIKPIPGATLATGLTVVLKDVRNRGGGGVKKSSLISDSNEC